MSSGPASNSTITTTSTSSLASLLHSLYKAMLHLITGMCELERIAAASAENRRGGSAVEEEDLERTVSLISKSLKRSKTLKDCHEAAHRTSIAGSTSTSSSEQEEDACDKRLAPQALAGEIVRVKGFMDARLLFALVSLARTRWCIQELNRLASTQFGNDNLEHDALLEKLWSSLKSESKRAGREGSRQSSSWGDIGFQGNDPSTDFRGAGVLSLHSLVYFCSTQGDVARRILTEQCGDLLRGGFPFAVAGINVTAALLEMLRQGELDDVFLFVDHTIPSESLFLPAAGAVVTVSSTTGLDADERTGLLSSAPVDRHQRRTKHVKLSKKELLRSIDAWTLSRTDESQSDLKSRTKAQALEMFNVAFAACFSLFARRWKEAAPDNAMAFPKVFAGVKTEIRKFAKQGVGSRGVAFLRGDAEAAVGLAYE